MPTKRKSQKQKPINSAPLSSDHLIQKLMDTIDVSKAISHLFALLDDQERETQEQQTEIFHDLIKSGFFSTNFDIGESYQIDRFVIWCLLSHHHKDKYCNI